MKKTLKIIWLLSAMIVLLSLIWFLLCSTACFQKSLDLIRTVILTFAGIPAVIFISFSVIVFIKDWIPDKLFARICVLISIILFTVGVVTTFISNSSIDFWLKESVSRDYMQITDDGKYEYRLELVNMFQKNSYARIYIKSLYTDDELTIPLDIKTNEMVAIIGGEGYTTSYDEFYTWSKLETTDEEGIYILKTTDFLDRERVYYYRININNNTAIPMH